MKSTVALWIGISLLAWLAVSANAADETSEMANIAVLEFQNKANLTSDEVLYLSDQVRGAVRKNLPRENYKVMTRETLDVLLETNQIDKAKCSGVCELTLGRKIGADYVIMGEIRRMPGQLSLSLSMKLYSSGKGDFLAIEEVRGVDSYGLKDGIDKQVPLLVAELAMSSPGLLLGSGGLNLPSGPLPTTADRPKTSQVTRVNRPSVKPVGGGAPALFIKTNPPGADVLINGVKVGMTEPAFQMTDLKPGRYELTFRRHKYHDARLEVELKAGLYKFDNVVLPKASGQLWIDSNPAGASVFIGGELLGQTPYLVEDYPSGTYLLEVKKSIEGDVGYYPVRESVVVRDGQETAKSYRLSANFGTLVIDSDPADAGVYWNKDYLGQTPLQKVLLPGKGTIRLKKNGYDEALFTATIASGQTVTLRPDQARLTQQVASLGIFVKPPEDGIEIRLDGEVKGMAPLSLSQLPAGNHIIEAAGNGRRGSQAITLAGGETRNIVIELDSPRAAWQNSSSVRYKAKSSHVRLAPMLTMTGSLGAATSAGVFFLKAVQTRDELLAAQERKSSIAEQQDLYDKAKQQATISYASWGVSGSLAVLSTVLFLWPDDAAATTGHNHPGKRRPLFSFDWQEGQAMVQLRWGMP